MRRAIGFLALTLLVFLAAPAGAKEMVWQGTVSLEFVKSSYSPAEITGGGVATVNGSFGGFALETLRIAGGITGSALVPVTDPEITPTVPSLRAFATLGTGTLAPFSASTASQPLLTRNQLIVRGVVRVCLLVSGCANAFDIPLTADDGGTGLGVGGTITAGGYGTVRISVEMAPWTIGTASMTVSTSAGAHVKAHAFGFVHGPWSFTGSTAYSGGELQLVTPMSISSGSTFGRDLALFGRLTLRFVPEPGPVPLLFPGLAFLAFLGSRRVRH